MYSTSSLFSKILFARIEVVSLSQVSDFAGSLSCIGIETCVIDPKIDPIMSNSASVSFEASDCSDTIVVHASDIASMVCGCGAAPTSIRCSTSQFALLLWKRFWRESKGIRGGRDDRVKLELKLGLDVAKKISSERLMVCIEELL